MSLCISFGRNIRDNHPQQICNIKNFPDLAKAILSGNMGGFLAAVPAKNIDTGNLSKTERNKIKTELPYICPPLGGDGLRRAVNAQPWQLLMLDFDEVGSIIDFPNQIVDNIIGALQSIAPCFAHTTISHTNAAPRFRAFLELSQTVNSEQSRSIAEWIKNRLSHKLPEIYFATKKTDDLFNNISFVLIDTTMQDAVHAAFLPCGNFSQFTLQENPPPPLDVESILAAEVEQARTETGIVPTAPAVTKTYSTPSPAAIEDALNHLDPDMGREEWRNIIFAIRSTGLPEARQIAENWSRRGVKFEQAEFDKLWNDGQERVDGNLITIGTLFHYAQKAGWQHELPLGTDLQNMQAFLAEHGEDFLYSPALGGMFAWENEMGFWINDEEEIMLERRIMAFAHERKLLAQAALARNPDNKALKSVLKTAKAFCNRTRLIACKNLAKSIVAIKDEIGAKGFRTPTFDSNGPLLGTPGGTVEITEKGWKIRQAQREDMLTMRATYTPKRDHSPQQFLAVLKRALQDDELVEFVLMSLGASLLGLAKPHIVIFVGQGRDGKSLISMTVARILGDYAHISKAAVFSTGSKNRDGESPEAQLLALQGKRFVVIPEVDSKITLKTDLIKQLTGGDGITARSPHAQRTKTFEPVAGLLMFGNSMPELPLQQEGISMKRRIRVVQFTHSISEEEEDPTLFDRLPKEEGQVILALLLDYAVKYLKARQKLPECEAVRLVSDTYSEGVDPASEWFNENTRPRQEGESGELFADLYADYQDHTMMDGDNPMSERAFSTWLVGKGVRQLPSRSAGKRRYDIAFKRSDK